MMCEYRAAKPLAAAYKAVISALRMCFAKDCRIPGGSFLSWTGDTRLALRRHIRANRTIDADCATRVLQKANSIVRRAALITWHLSRNSSSPVFRPGAMTIWMLSPHALKTFKRFGAKASSISTVRLSSQSGCT